MNAINYVNAAVQFCRPYIRNAYHFAEPTLKSAYRYAEPTLKKTYIHLTKRNICIAAAITAAAIIAKTLFTPSKTTIQPFSETPDDSATSATSSRPLEESQARRTDEGSTPARVTASNHQYETTPLGGYQRHQRRVSDPGTPAPKPLLTLEDMGYGESSETIGTVLFPYESGVQDASDEENAWASEPDDDELPQDQEHLSAEERRQIQSGFFQIDQSITGNGRIEAEDAIGQRSSSVSDVVSSMEEDGATRVDSQPEHMQKQASSLGDTRRRHINSSSSEGVQGCIPERSISMTDAAKKLTGISFVPGRPIKESKRKNPDSTANAAATSPPKRRKLQFDVGALQAALQNRGPRPPTPTVDQRLRPPRQNGRVPLPFMNPAALAAVSTRLNKAPNTPVSRHKRSRSVDSPDGVPPGLPFLKEMQAGVSLSRADQRRLATPQKLDTPEGVKVLKARRKMIADTPEAKKLDSRTHPPAEEDE